MQYKIKVPTTLFMLGVTLCRCQRFLKELYASKLLGSSTLLGGFRDFKGQYIYLTVYLSVYLSIYLSRGGGGTLG